MTKTVKSLNRTQVVTFPRSGHHYLMRILNYYFESSMHYCEFYGHCQRVPCIESSTNVQKNHDFGLKYKCIKGWSHIIQYRNPEGCLTSYYSFLVSKGQISHNLESWKNFLKEKAPYWLGFMDKWILPESKNLKVRYSDIVGTNRIKYIISIIRFVSSEESIDYDLIHDSLNKEPTKVRNARDFEFYDEYDFRELNNKWNLLSRR